LNGKAILKIPLGKMAEGADLCLENASQFCFDARVLIEKSSYEHALALCIFAIEELGKATMLKEKAAYASARSEENMVFESVEPEVYFNRPKEYLKTRGFSGKRINPFYHHPSKFFYAGKFMSMATQDRIVKSLEGRKFETLEEIDKTIEEIWKQALKITPERTDLRELALYVDYDQQKGIWSKGRLKLTSMAINQLATDIEKAIELNHQWKIPSP
jgi:hypothetical protein